MQQVIIVGAEKELIEMAVSCSNVIVLGVIDANREMDTLGVPWLGTDDAWPEIRAKFPEAKVVFGLDDPLKKRALLAAYGKSLLATVISPHATVSRTATISSGAIIQTGCRIGPLAYIGSACKLNIDAAVHHDCKVGECCTMGPGSRILGNVTLADGVFVGAEAVVLPKLSVGANTVIGAGAVVVANVESGTVVAGVPARTLKRAFTECR